jgi:hypothetical protein
MAESKYLQLQRALCVCRATLFGGNGAGSAADYFVGIGGRTLSVLPKNRLPYIALNTTILESDFDARASGTDPPPASEKERGCLRAGL